MKRFLVAIDMPEGSDIHDVAIAAEQVGDDTTVWTPDEFAEDVLDLLAGRTGTISSFDVAATAVAETIEAGERGSSDGHKWACPQRQRPTAPCTCPPADETVRALLMQGAVAASELADEHRERSRWAMESDADILLSKAQEADDLARLLTDTAAEIPYRHTHAEDGQKLTHRHAGLPHGYWEHDEDPTPAGGHDTYRDEEPEYLHAHCRTCRVGASFRRDRPDAEQLIEGWLAEHRSGPEGGTADD